jgi:hypothetical protein
MLEPEPQLKLIRPDSKTLSTIVPHRQSFPLAGSRRRENEPHRSCSTSGSVGKRHTSSRCQGMLAVLKIFFDLPCTHRAHAAFKLFENLESSFQSIIGAT